MYCHVGVNLNIKLMDSLNFLNMALSRLPKSFGLEELKKGYFPHLYSTEEILCDVFLQTLHHLPNMSLYDPNNMSCKKRHNFLLWYKKKPNIFLLISIGNY